MVKARLITETGETVFFLGLSDGNLQRLREGRPMRIPLATLGGTDTVLIHYGHTEQAIVEELRQKGVRL